MKGFVGNYTNDTIRNDPQENRSFTTLREYIHFFDYLEINQRLSGLELEINNSNPLVSEGKPSNGSDSPYTGETGYFPVKLR